MPPAPLSEAFNALSQFLVADIPLGETLKRVADISVDAVEPALFAGLSMLDDQGRPTTAVFTDPTSPEIDQAQYESGRGPCLDAWRTKQVVRMDDLDSGMDQYPEFSVAAKEHGILSTLSLPLIAADRGLGAMNLYATTRAAFSEEDEATGMQLAAAASAVLANAVSYWGAYDLSQQMKEAMQSRAVIEQAKGFLMARTPELNAKGAFEILVKASQRENRKLREVAQDIVDRRRRPEPGRSAPDAG